MTKPYFFKIFVFILLLIDQSSFAQVIYTDIFPDSVISATVNQTIQSYFIDLDNDSNDDFELRHFNAGPGLKFIELHGEMIGSKEVLVTSDDHARLINLGDTIGAGSIKWGNDIYGVLDSTWYGVGDKFFGFRFKINSQWHYAWARMQVASDSSSFTIKDYAYESTSSKAIIAGHNTSIGLREDTDLLEFSIYPNPFTTQVIIACPHLCQEFGVEVYSLNGEKLNVTANVEGDNIIVERGILSTGVFLFKLIHRPTAITTEHYILIVD